MARPRKTYPFESLEPGKSRKFTVMRYAGADLQRMINAVYRRRKPGGGLMYSAESQIVGGQYVSITVTRLEDVTDNAPVQENHEMLQLTFEF